MISRCCMFVKGGRGRMPVACIRAVIAMTTAVIHSSMRCLLGGEARRRDASYCHSVRTFKWDLRMLISELIDVDGVQSLWRTV